MNVKMAQTVMMITGFVIYNSIINITYYGNVVMHKLSCLPVLV